jgi:hypothetical protein
VGNVYQDLVRLAFVRTTTNFNEARSVASKKFGREKEENDLKSRNEHRELSRSTTVAVNNN